MPLPRIWHTALYQDLFTDNSPVIITPEMAKQMGLPPGEDIWSDQSQRQTFEVEDDLDDFGDEDEDEEPVRLFRVGDTSPDEDDLYDEIEFDDGTPEHRNYFVVLLRKTPTGGVLVMYSCYVHERDIFIWTTLTSEQLERFHAVVVDTDNN